MKGCAGACRTKRTLSLFVLKCAEVYCGLVVEMSLALLRLRPRMRSLHVPLSAVLKLCRDTGWMGADVNEFAHNSVFLW